MYTSCLYSSEPRRRLINFQILEIRDGEFAWSHTAKDATLYDINIEVKKGALFGILGRVGCGKSSLLSAVIGEMRRTSGSVTVSGSVAYVPQTPWIQSASVRDNILFSHRYDEEFYGLALEGEFRILGFRIASSCAISLCSDGRPGSNARWRCYGSRRERCEPSDLLQVI
jgi:hypothetical protein